MFDTLPPLQKLVQDIKLVLHDVCGLKNVAGLAAALGGEIFVTQTDFRAVRFKEVCQRQPSASRTKTWH